MKKDTIGIERRKPMVAALDRSDRLQAHKEDLFRAVSERAYSLFRHRGGEHGYDLADWLSAESEILRPMPCELAHKGNELMVRAEVPGFNERELHIVTASHQVWISGHKERVGYSTSQGLIFNELQAKDVFRIIELPVAIDPNNASAMLHAGILTIFMRKAGATNNKATGKAA